MSSMKIEIIVPTPFETVQEILEYVLNHWVERYQNKTTIYEQIGIAQVAADSFTGTAGLSSVIGQGVQPLSKTTFKVLIPAASTTYGGEMRVTATLAENKGTSIEIKGHTQGLFNKTLVNNVNGLRDYLVKALPEFAQKSGELLKSQTNENKQSEFSVAKEIEHLSELHTKGILTDAEYMRAKEKILA